MTMERKKFFKLVGAGSLGAVTLSKTMGCTSGIGQNPGEPSGKKRVLMKVGCEAGGTTKENLEFKARCGVFNIDGGAPEMIKGVGWDLEDSLAKKEACEKYGITLEAYHLPLDSSGIDRTSMPDVMLGRSPERDKEIEILQNCIRVAGKTGIQFVTYNTTILPILRTRGVTDPKRGNATYSSWNYDEALKLNEPKTIAGDVSVDEIFERITYLLDRLMPVAKEYNVKLANHIADPPLSASYRGIMRWNSPDVFEGIKRFAGLYDSSHHGFLLCLGSVAEGLRDPKTEILPIIKWIGERNQIFNIHLRNIKGGLNNFQEVYPDNGDMDFLKIIRELRDVGYTGMLCPDHVPRHPDPGSSNEGFAFAYGYIKALIHAVSSEA
jgi:mannonate dehydratase